MAIKKEYGLVDNEKEDLKEVKEEKKIISEELDTEDPYD